MAVKIRLRRMGQKKAPFYRIVVADSRSPCYLLIVLIKPLNRLWSHLTDYMIVFF